MKKLLCFLLCLTLIFSSFSLSFAAGWSDSQISSVVSDLSTVKTTLNNIYNRLGTIMNYLYDDGHSVGYWASAIASWMQPIYQALTNNLVSALDIEPIISGLNEVVSSGGNTSYFPYLKYDGKSNANWVSDIANLFNGNWDNNLVANDRIPYIYSYTGTIGQSFTNTSYPSNMPFSQAQFMLFRNINNQIAGYFTDSMNRNLTGYNTQQSLVSFTDPDSTVTFTPLSSIDGIYKYLNALNTPLARLGYTLASDERIEAQEAAAANEDAVVDNFIDSNGNGSTSPSDIGSMSDLSSGYKQNFSTDASPSGIFDIFNSDHATWFSQETKNQLDTTAPTRSSKGSVSETPLLDKQIEDIYDALGVKQP